MEQKELIKMATETLFFIGSKVENNKDVIDIILHEALSQNYVGKRIRDVETSHA